jgi:hypothetical protein
MARRLPANPEPLSCLPNLIAEEALDFQNGMDAVLQCSGMVRLDLLSETTRDAAPLLDEVRIFHDACLRGDYFESFDVNSKNCMDTSNGTDAFMVEFERLLDKCIRASAKRRSSTVREAFELLFALLRRIDSDPDGVVFFADEGGSWQVGVDWRAALAAYFRCLANGTPAEHFAREVDRAIADFAAHDRLEHLATARRVASAEQKVALRSLAAVSSADHDGPERPPEVRIHGELRKLRIAVAQSTLANICLVLGNRRAVPPDILDFDASCRHTGAGSPLSLRN